MTTIRLLTEEMIIQTEEDMVEDTTSTTNKVSIKTLTNINNRNTTKVTEDKVDTTILVNKTPIMDKLR